MEKKVDGVSAVKPVKDMSERVLQYFASQDKKNHSLTKTIYFTVFQILNLIEKRPQFVTMVLVIIYRKLLTKKLFV